MARGARRRRVQDPGRSVSAKGYSKRNVLVSFLKSIAYFFNCSPITFDYYLIIITINYNHKLCITKKQIENAEPIYRYAPQSPPNNRVAAAASNRTFYHQWGSVFRRKDEEAIATRFLGIGGLCVRGACVCV